MDNCVKKYQVHFATTDEQILALFPVVQQVCPDIRTQSQLLRIARTMISQENCHFVFIEDQLDNNGDKIPVSFGAYRLLSSLSRGNHMHIHYMATLPTGKRRGFASAILNWIVSKAKELKCECITMNSGHSRLDAHRLYMNKGFALQCHHFCLQLTPFNAE